MHKVAKQMLQSETEK